MAGACSGAPRIRRSRALALGVGDEPRLLDAVGAHGFVFLARAAAGPCGAEDIAGRILLTGKRATAVVLQDGRTVNARREVILSAGAIISPKILMLSGIGDGDDLKSNGIETVHHLPGVGRNHQDHAAIGMQMKTKSRIPYGFSV